MNRKKLFIFDMDGLLLDTGRLAFRAYVKSAKQYDYEMVHGVYYYLTGRTEAGIIQAMAELYGEEQDVFAWRQAIHTHRKEILDKEKKAGLKKGAREMLAFAKENGMKVALASSTKRETAAYFLEIENIAYFFDYIITGDEVKKGKPDKEIFATACEKAGIPPANAVVFEDSIVGVKASRNAGICSCLIPDDITDMPTYIGRHKIVKDINALLVSDVTADYSFKDLLEARSFFEKNDFRI